MLSGQEEGGLSAFLLFQPMEKDPVRERYLYLPGPLEEPVNWSPVPWGRFLTPQYRFSPPDGNEVAQAFERVHAFAEAVRVGDGRYLDDRSVRSTSRRVIGYLEASKVLSHEVYRQRALEGLEYLLREQREDGQFVWYRNSHRGLAGLDHSLYDTAICGVAFVLAYQVTGDERFLAASRRALSWAVEMPISSNTNYNLFTVWHLADHYRIDPQRQWIEAAVYRAKEGGCPNQLPSGGWPGHNSYIWYHGINLRGFSALDRALPAGHPMKDEIRGRLTAGFNRCILEQLETGEVPSQPGRSGGEHNAAFPLMAGLMAEGTFDPFLNSLVSGLLNYNLRVGVPKALPPTEALTAEVRKAIADAEVTVGEPVLRFDFDEFRVDPNWGSMAEGWLPAWIPGRQPTPFEARWLANETYALSGSRCQEYRVRGCPGDSGMGRVVPEGVLRPDGRYRFQIWCMALENTRAAGSLSSLYCSVYSGPPRPVWDCYTGCQYTVETPARGRFSPVWVDFTAGEANHLYAAFQGIDPGPEGEMALIVDFASVSPILSEPPVLSIGARHVEVQLMALGMALAARCGPECGQAIRS